MTETKDSSTEEAYGPQGEGGIGQIGLQNGPNVVFFGNSISVECQRCGAYSNTSVGHKYCQHVTCPLAQKEFKRRKRRRTSTLEQVYMAHRFK